jgi:hypothetical protein
VNRERWIEANQSRLTAGIEELRLLLSRHARGVSSELDLTLQRARARERAAIAAMPGSAALDVLEEVFGLSEFERRLLLLCAGVELDAELSALCAEAQGDSARAYPTFSLALAALPDGHWSALSPAGPLRVWRLIEMNGHEGVTRSALRIDERVLHHLTGVSYLDERLQALLRPVPPDGLLSVTHARLAEHVAALWQNSGNAEAAVIQLVGPDAAGCRAVAAAACRKAGASLYALRAGDVPAAANERELLRILWEREVVLEGCVLLLDCHDDERDLRAALALLESLRCPVLVASPQPLRIRARRRFRIDVPRPEPAERARMLAETLGEPADSKEIEAVVAQFELGLDGIQSAGAHVRAQAAAGRSDEPLGRLLWNACRMEARPRLDDLAQRIEPAARWDELVLPPPQKEILRQIIANVAQRNTVYERWGFAERSNRGLGISAVFVGASGTGKTMAAEVVANELRLDLYRIDLSQVVSKYIGETEKNLSRVFDAAEEGGAVLLFDEADALFGKRSEVKDSHDRYANIEVSYLLQRMEAYRGLAILTTNQKSALDTSFLRRIRFLVQFPFPDAPARVEIWRRVFPTATPTEGLDPHRLARLNVAGGNIRNIALNAAFLAAGAGEPVRMSHLLRAAQGEYAKLEKPLTDAEVAGWR